MPSHKSAEKSVRQAEKRARVNKARISRIRTFVKKVESSIAVFGKDPAVTIERIQCSLGQAEKELMRGASRGVMHKNAASRKVSRLTHKVKQVSASS